MTARKLRKVKQRPMPLRLQVTPEGIEAIEAVNLNIEASYGSTPTDVRDAMRGMLTQRGDAAVARIAGPRGKPRKVGNPDDLVTLAAYAYHFATECSASLHCSRYAAQAL